MKTMFLVVLTAFLCVGCATTRYVPIETVRTEYKNRTDTVIQKDTVEREKTVTVMEVDSDLLAKYGILLRQNRNTQNAYLVLQKEIEREKSKRLEIHTDTIIKTDSIPVPHPVERELTKWETFCLDYGKVMTGCTLVLIVLSLLMIVRWITGRRK